MKYIKQIISSATIIFMVACSAPLTEEQVLNNANDFINKNEANTAKIVLQKYLVDNSDAERPRMLLAEVLTLMGDYDGALNQFNRLNTPLTVSAFERKVEAHYMLSEMPLALDAIKSYQANKALPYRTSALVYALLSTRLEQDDSLILEMQENISKKEKKTLVDKLIDATISFYQDNDEEKYYEKLKVISENDKTYTTNYLFLDLLGNFAFISEDYETAVSTFKHLVELRPSFFKTRLLIADSLVRDEKWGEAEKYVNLILKKNESQPIANQLKAVILIKDNDLEKAKIHIEKAIAGGYETRQNYLMAADLNFQLKNYEQTISFLEKGLRDVAVNTNYHNMLLYAKAAMGGSESIMDAIKGIKLTTMSDIQNVISYFEGLDSVGNQQQANRLHEVITLDPQASPAAQLEFSVFNMRNNPQENYKTALQASKDLIANALEKPNSSTEAQLVTAKSIVIGDLLERKQLKEAENTVNTWLQSEEKKELNTMYLADIYNHEKKYEQTKAILNPDNVEFINAHMYILLSNAYANTQKLDVALNTAKDGLSKFSYNIPLLRQVAMIESMLNVTESNFIREVYAKPTTSIEDAISLNYYYSIREQKQNAISALENFTKADEKNITYWYALAESYLSVNNKEKAKTAISNTLNANMLTVEQIEMILNTLSKVDAIDESIKLLEQQVPNYPANGRFKLLLSDLYLEKGNVKLAKSTIDQLNANDPDTIIQQAEVSLRSGNLAGASDLYKKAYTQFPSQKTLIPYAQHLELAGKSNQAVEMLASFAQKNPTAINAFLLLATMQTGQPAIDNYNKVLALNPNNLVALNNLALELNKQNKREDAMKVAQKALTIAPDNEEVKNTLELINTKR